MPYFPIKTYLCDIDICKTKVDNSDNSENFYAEKQQKKRMKYLHT